MECRGRGSAAVVAALLVFSFSVSQAAQYTVGGSQEWNLQVDYDTWASQNKFQVGDTLLFTYSPEAHNVVQLSSADYDSCSLASPIKTWDDGNTVVTLSDATTYYFICGIPTHCQSGMKVAVPVLASAAAPTASNTTPPASPPSVATPTAPPPVATPPSTPPVAPPSTPPVAAPSVSPAAPPVATPSPSPSVPASPPTPTPSPATPTPPSPSSTPSASSLPPSPSTPTISSPPVFPGPAPGPAVSDAVTSAAVQVLSTIISTGFVGALLL